LRRLPFSVLATAVPPGEASEFNNLPESKVTFDGALHKGKGFKCTNCHTSIFGRARTVQIRIKKEGQEGGKACFPRHDGNKSFAAKDNCAR